MADPLAGATPPAVSLAVAPAAAAVPPPTVAPATVAVATPVLAKASVSNVDAAAVGITPPTQPASSAAIANSDVVVPSTPISPIVTLLGEVTRTLSDVPKVNNTGDPISSIFEWWAGDSIRLGGTADHDAFCTVDRDAWHGLVSTLYDYNAAAADNVIVVDRWGVGAPAGWTAIEEPTIGREKYGYPANLVNAIERAGTGDWTPLTQILRTRSWSLDGTSLVNFSRMLGQTMAMEVGFSPAPVFIRIFGYILSGLLPVDRGGPGAAVMADPLVRTPSGNWFPYSGQPAAVAPQMDCIYITSEVFVRWQLGQIALGVFNAGDIDRSIIVVPVDHEFLIRPAALAVLAIGMLEYPVRCIRANGQLFDAVNPLTRTVEGVQQPYLADWFPASSLVRVRGPGTAVNNAVRIVFVRSTGSPMAAGGPETLHLPGGVAILLTTVGGEPAAPNIGNFGLCLDNFFGDGVNITGSVPHFWEGFMRATSLFGAGQAITTMVQFWGASCTLWGRPWESTGTEFAAAAVHTFVNGVAPRYSHARNVAKEVIQIIQTPAGAHPSWVVMNSVGQLWNMVYPPNGGGPGARNPNAIHWYLPQFNSIFGVAVACGIVVPDPLSEPLRFAEVTDLVAHSMRIGMSYTALSDVYFIIRNVTRRHLQFFCAGAPDVVANTGFLRSVFGQFWGTPSSRPLRGSVSVCDDMRRNFFMNKLAPFFPTNGVVFEGGALGWRDAGLDTSNACGLQLFGRMPTPTLCRYLEIPISGVETSAFGEVFFKNPIMLRNLANTSNDYGCGLQLSSRDWEGCWKQAREFAGCFGGAGAEVLGAFGLYPRNSPHIRERITVMRQPDGARISFACGADGIAGLASKYSVGWDRYLSPTLERPFSPFDARSNLELALVCTNRNLARSNGSWFYPRVAYDLPLHLSTWLDNTTDAVGLIGAIGMSPF